MRISLAAILCVGVALPFSSCKKGCDTEDLPQYSLTPGLRAWAAPYPKDAVLRFRNARTGYVRSYRVTTAENVTADPVSGGGIDVCPQYYREYSAHLLQRTDSTGNVENKEIFFRLIMDRSTRLQTTFVIGSTSLEPPLQAIEDGTVTLSPATFAGRTYPAVWGGTIPNTIMRPGVVTTLFLTKADGLIRFEERGGTVWDRQ